MNFLKLLLLLAVAGVCVYFYLGDKKKSNENAPQPASSALSASSASSASPALRPLPPASDVVPAPGSLAAKIMAVDARRPYLQKGNMRHNDLRSYYWKADIEKKGIPNLKEAKKVLAKMEGVFEEYRKLNECTTLGITPIADPRWGLPYLQPMRVVVWELLFSAEYHFLCGNKKQGLKDIETALHVTNLLVKEASYAIDLLVAVACSSYFAPVIKRINLPAKEKERILRKLPGREQYAAALPAVLKSEKNMLLFSLEWAPELEHAAMEKIIKAPRPRNTSAEAAEEQRKKVRKEMEEYYGNLKKLKEIPVEKLEKVYADCAAFLVKSFKENTLTRETKYTTGSAEDDRIFAMLQKVLRVNFASMFSEKIDRLEKHLGLKK